MSIAQLLQQGFIHVATFNHEERATARAEFHRRQGHDSRVITQHGRSGIQVFSVYIKLKEA